MIYFVKVTISSHMFLKTDFWVCSRHLDEYSSSNILWSLRFVFLCTWLYLNIKALYNGTISFIYTFKLWKVSLLTPAHRGINLILLSNFSGSKQNLNVRCFILWVPLGQGGRQFKQPASCTFHLAAAVKVFSVRLPSFVVCF